MELKDKILQELNDKVKKCDACDTKKIAIYVAIATYVCNENLSEEYKEFINNKDNSLDYLYNAYLENRHNYYEQIKEALDFDQKTF